MVRAVVVVINKENLEACQVDVRSPFLNGAIEEKIYMIIPEGVEIDEDIRRLSVFNLKKPLYGLKLSPES